MSNSAQNRQQKETTYIELVRKLISYATDEELNVLTKGIKQETSKFILARQAEVKDAFKLYSSLGWNIDNITDISKYNYDINMVQLSLSKFVGQNMVSLLHLPEPKNYWIMVVNNKEVLLVEKYKPMHTTNEEYIKKYNYEIENHMDSIYDALKSTDRVGILWEDGPYGIEIEYLDDSDLIYCHGVPRNINKKEE